MSLVVLGHHWTTRADIDQKHAATFSIQPVRVPTPWAIPTGWLVAHGKSGLLAHAAKSSRSSRDPVSRTLFVLEADF